MTITAGPGQYRPKPPPGSPERVPVDSDAYKTIASLIADTISQHRPVPRGEGLVGNHCRHHQCGGRVFFLTLRQGYMHQAQEIIRAIRMEAAFTLTDGEDPAEDAAYIQSIVELFNLGSQEEPGGESPE
ncbi:hypothetical protein [Arthrobacter sp. IK3]|uniref:hypothetical protein n=1 Tax=Arthrobacter sp. IK3 TaxID=3448169 RepID=UPI003EE08CAD